MVLVERLCSKIYEIFERNMIGSLNFAFVSNNCWGYQLYKTCNRPYNTPFVGLFLYPDCFLKICKDLNLYLNMSLEKVDFSSKYVNSETEYPVGHLGEIEIHFLHYTGVEEAKVKWNGRASRLLKYYKEGKPIFFQFNDKDGALESDITQFHSIIGSDRSISFANFSLSVKNHFHVNPANSYQGKVVDGVKLYRARYKYFSLVRWIYENQN